MQFLLESHVLQIDEASTPLRQLYFILQVMLMNPTGANDAYEMFRRSLPLMIASFSDREISGTLKQIDRMVGEGHVYEALKAIRGALSARTPRARRERRCPVEQRSARPETGPVLGKHDAPNRRTAGAAR